jgi:CheY-like chemotaxis protein
MDLKKALLFSKTFNKDNVHFKVFKTVTSSLGYEIVHINNAEQALHHLREDRGSVLFCDAAIFFDQFEQTLSETPDMSYEGSGLVIISTDETEDYPSSPFIDSVLVLSLPASLLELSLVSIFKHMYLKNSFQRSSNTIDPDFLKKLLSDTAHAVNNILSGMQGYAELAQLNHDDAKLIQDAFNVVLYSSQRVKQEIKNLRALIRVENPDVKPVNVLEVIESSVELAKNQMTSKKIHLKYGAEDRVMLNADYDQLIQVFFNLLNDVVNNLDEEGTISLQVKGNDDHVAFKIVGDRYSLSDEEFESYKTIFSMELPILQTADEEGKIDYRSILSVCNRIVRNHGGTLHMEKSKQGEVVYTITLPVLVEDIKVLQTEQAQEEGSVANINDLDMDILVVDDEEYVRNTIYYFFDMKGCRVTVAEDGEFGFDIAKSNPFDLIFMDYLMPKMGGIESARKIMEKHKDAKIVFITGRESINEEDLYKAGIYACIRKPFEMKDLFDIAKRVAFQKGLVE